jgi:hypothetical protein
MIFAVYNNLGLHVSATPRDVVKAAWRMLAPIGKARRNRANRREFYRRLLREHTAAIELYVRVQGGASARRKG